MAVAAFWRASEKPNAINPLFLSSGPLFKRADPSFLLQRLRTKQAKPGKALRNFRAISNVIIHNLINASRRLFTM